MKRLFALLTAGALGLGLGSDITASAGTTNNQQVFASECSACHMAYQGFFLPKRSWSSIMGDLSNHFGEDASLDETSRQAIEAYLVKNAADRDGKNPRWLSKIPKTEVPIRITELSWFRHEHGSRVLNWVKSHPNVGSVSNCTACHKGADRGYFDDD